MRSDPTYAKAPYRRQSALDLLARSGATDGRPGSEPAGAALARSSGGGSGAGSPAVARSECMLEVGIGLSHGKEKGMEVALACARLLGPLPWRLSHSIHVNRLVGPVSDHQAAVSSHHSALSSHQSPAILLRHSCVSFTPAQSESRSQAHSGFLHRLTRGDRSIVENLTGEPTGAPFVNRCAPGQPMQPLCPVVHAV